MPSTKLGISFWVTPTPFKPFGTPSSDISASILAVRRSPASSKFASSVGAPSNFAAWRCRSEHESAVNRKTAGAVTITETTSVLTSNTDTPDTTMNLSLASDGDITGTAPTPTTATTYTFTLQAEDAENQTATREYSITVSVGATGGGQFN